MKDIEKVFSGKFKYDSLTGKSVIDLFFLFLEIFIQDMQFIYTDICLNNLRYELHKLHFPNFSRLLSPPMARAQTTLYIKKKNPAIFNFVSGSLP